MLRRTLLAALLPLVVLSIATPALGTLAAQAKPPKQQGVPATPAAANSQAALAITAAIVMTDMTVRHLPEFALELLDEADSTKRIPLRTALDGTITTILPIGHYVLRSVAPVVLNDSSYQWSVPIDLSTSGNKIELTNANATSSSARRVAARQVAPEREVFERVRRGVFRVEAGLGRGSGFFAQIPGIETGLVVTDDHVIANDTIASVYLDSVTRVPAVVVARDREADLALLRVPTSFARDRPLLQLAAPKGNEPLVISGERILAIGFPLHQQMTLTTGIVSSVRDGAIISDVNINHGNSGGPMLNLAGEVVGVNAFGDFTNQGGPGISGAIAITRLERVITKAQTAIKTTPAPEERALPALPLATYPIAALKEAADTVDPKKYRKLLQRGADHFTLNVTTPVLYRVEQRLFENEVGAERKQREAQSGISKDQTYSETRQSRDWEQFVGESNTPVVTIAISPNVGETSGSAFRRGLLGPLAQASLVFDGDVRGAHFYRNGVEVEAIAGGHGPIVQNFENMLVKLKDVADYGYYVLPPELFRPDSNGAPARVRVAIEDLKRPTETSGTEIDGELSARVWNDFRAYFQAVQPTKPFIAADPALPSPNVNMICDSGRCYIVK